MKNIGSIGVQESYLLESTIFAVTREVSRK